LNEVGALSFNLAVRVSTTSLAALLAFALPLTGCDDDVADSNFEPTSVPESKPIDDLDPEEQQDFCEEAASWADEFVGDKLTGIICNSSAIGESVGEDGSFDLATCKTKREACLSDPESATDFGSEEDLQCNFEGIDSCGATVGEFSSCFEETAQILDRVASEVTCERFAQGDYPDQNDVAPSAECQALFERCSSDATEGEAPPPE